MLLTLTDLGRREIEALRRDNVATLAAAVPLLRALSDRRLAAG